MVERRSQGVRGGVRALRPAVLVVSDQECMQNAFRAIFELSGARVRCSRPEEEALGKVVPTDFVLAVVDLPHRTGLLTVAQLRAQQSALPICFVTSYYSPEFRARALEAGCEECFVKPVRLEELGRILAHGVRKREVMKASQHVIGLRAEPLLGEKQSSEKQSSEKLRGESVQPQERQLSLPFC